MTANDTDRETQSSRYVVMVCHLADHPQTEIALPQGFRVGSLEGADEDALYRCYYAAFRAGDARFFFDQSEPERRAYFYTLRLEEARTEPGSSVIMHDSEIAGFTYVIPYGAGNRHISCMCVHPDYGRQGLGTYMLRYAKGQVAAQGGKSITLGTGTAMGAFQLYRKHGFEIVEEPVDFYRAYGKHTNPGELVHLYQGLPESLEDLCDLIKAQLIHPAELERYADALPEGRKREDAGFYSVEDMLRELVARNPRGMVMDRKPAERLVLSCRFHAMMLASMVKSQGIPARVRVGFAGYLAPEQGKHFDHWVTEVWNEGEARWMTVDADTKRVDIHDFEIAGDVWLAAQRGEIDPQVYGFHIWWGLGYVVGNLCHDLWASLNEELIYWEGPELMHKGPDRLSAEETAFVDRLARLLQHPEDNLDELTKLRSEHPLLQNVRGTAPDL